jgi:hypothetical protein
MLRKTSKYFASSSTVNLLQNFQLTRDPKILPKVLQGCRSLPPTDGISLLETLFDNKSLTTAETLKLTKKFLIPFLLDNITHYSADDLLRIYKIHSIKNLHDKFNQNLISLILSRADSDKCSFSYSIKILEVTFMSPKKSRSPWYHQEIIELIEEHIDEYIDTVSDESCLQLTQTAIRYEIPFSVSTWAKLVRKFNQSQLDTFKSSELFKLVLNLKTEEDRHKSALTKVEAEFLNRPILTVDVLMSVLESETYSKERIFQAKIRESLKYAIQGNIDVNKIAVLAPLCGENEMKLILEHCYGDPESLTVRNLALLAEVDERFQRLLEQKIGAVQSVDDLIFIAKTSQRKLLEAVKDQLRRLSCGDDLDELKRTLFLGICHPNQIAASLDKLSLIEISKSGIPGVFGEKDPFREYLNSRIRKNLTIERLDRSLDDKVKDIVLEIVCEKVQSNSEEDFGKIFIVCARIGKIPNDEAVTWKILDSLFYGSKDLESFLSFLKEANIDGTLGFAEQIVIESLLKKNVEVTWRLTGLLTELKLFNYEIAERLLSFFGENNAVLDQQPLRKYFQRLKRYKPSVVRELSWKEPEKILSFLE